VSILLVKVETNWSISPSRTRADTGRIQKLEVQAPARKMMGEAAQIPPWPSKERSQPLPFTHRTGNDGIAWDFMGVNGAHPGVHEFRTGKRGKRPLSSSFLVNRRDCRLRAKRVTTANERGCTISAADSRGRGLSKEDRSGAEVAPLFLIATRGPRGSKGAWSRDS